MKTLYTPKELSEWKDVSNFPDFQRSHNQKILNLLCVREMCSYGSRTLLGRVFDLNKLAEVAKLLGFISNKFLIFKDVVMSLVVLEYIAILLSCGITSGNG